MTNLEQLKKEIEKKADQIKAKHSARFFKTGKGEYGEGDKFLGLTVPDQRKIAKNYYKQLSLQELAELIKSEYHEHRLTALFILVLKFEREKDEDKIKEIVDFYLKNRAFVNNWDLVDSSAHKILGEWLLDKKDRIVLYDLARSGKLWDERIAIIGTLQFIRKGHFEDSLKISKILLHHKHDLIHKAVGWMLREVGKKDETVLVKFLKEHYKDMPRTMLRYAIEKFDKKIRDKYLAGKI